ncbi:MAG: ATP-binding protein [Planctomycetota bacterium]
MSHASVPSQSALTQGDLSQLFAAFNDVTVKLQDTHEKLSGEVSRLQGELRRANDELERSRRLAALGEMAAGIAHEIRNPLGSIGLYAEMLESDLAGGRGHDIASKIVRAVHGLDAVVNDVLTFSREMRVERVSQCSDEVFAAALDSCRDVVGGCSVVVRGEAAIEADAALLQQAMVNLVRNAAEAVQSRALDDHEIVLEARESVAGAGERAIVLSVSDTGPGVPTEIRERLFNPFFTTRAAGTGLGLAIVQRIADAHGGAVRVNSRPATSHDPGGATVELIIPRSSNPTDREQAAATADPRSAA